MPTLRREDAELYYEVHGSGEGVVLAHGTGGNTLSWWQQIPFLARRRRVLVFDHRGFGRSRCAPEAVRPERFPDDLAALLDAAGLERAALVGQSLGGFTALPFALGHPDRATAIVLAGSPGGVAIDAVARDAATVPARAARLGLLGMTTAPGFPEREPALAGLYVAIQGLNRPETLASIPPRLAALRVEPADLAGLAVPTLVLGGSHDAFFSPDTLREVAATIPGARFVEVPGCGHSPYFEDADRFNRIVAEFLDQAT